MRTITLLQPRRLTFGSGCLRECQEYVAANAGRDVHILTSRSLAARVEEFAAGLGSAGKYVTIHSAVPAEPTIAAFYAALSKVKKDASPCVVGIGGGSVLDIAKLVAAFAGREQKVEDSFGIDLLTGRECHLVCVPTTSGTGSEVSPNAILLDEQAKLKKGVVSPWLVPDAAFVDPELTLSLPAAATASTGMDALTHCIEAYTNKFAHPLIDGYALQGIALCAKHLPTAVRNGSDVAAREGMSLASLYGGLCLGPVNTAAVHALAYPLGGEFHVPHGLSNALLLPGVFRFNAEASPSRHAEVALTLGATPQGSNVATALEGAQQLRKLSAACGLSGDLEEYGVTHASVPAMARAALTVTRLLKNNPRELSQADAEQLYLECFAA